MIQFFIYSFTGLIIFAVFLPLSANCQQTYNPNLGHFYMGRQQITIEDSSPIINDKTGGGTAGGANGALMNRTAPLPKAGWQPYAPIETPGINPNLPKVPGPVRQSHNPQSRKTAGIKSRAGHITAGAHPKSAPANGVRSYQPYAQYSPPPSNTQAAQELGASTRVKGSLLHWARRNPPPQ